MPRNKRDPTYLRRCIEFLKHFARISGLQCNQEKTAVIPIDGNYDINDKLCTELALSWEDNFTLLGFQMDNRLKHLNENYKKCFKKVHEISSDRQNTDSCLKAASQLLRPS